MCAQASSNTANTNPTATNVLFWHLTLHSSSVSMADIKIELTASQGGRCEGVLPSELVSDKHSEKSKMIRTAR